RGVAWRRRLVHRERTGLAGAARIAGAWTLGRRLALRPARLSAGGRVIGAVLIAGRGRVRTGRPAILARILALALAWVLAQVLALALAWVLAQVLSQVLALAWVLALARVLALVLAWV